MAIAPITGTLRKKIITDISVGFGVGFALASLWWYGEHLPQVAKREAFYKKIAAEKESENSA